MSLHLTSEAVAGYVAGDRALNPHPRSSPNSMAWSLGHWLRLQGCPPPREVRPGRGYTLHANGGRFDLTNESQPVMVVSPADVGTEGVASTEGGLSESAVRDDLFVTHARHGGTAC